MAALSPALLRALRSIDDGHLTLWGDSEIIADRVVIGLRGAWWQPLIEAGLLELAAGGRPHWRLSEEGRALLSTPYLP